MTKLHAGSPDKRQGVLHRGTAPKSNPVHGGSGAARVVHDASKPQPRQSWHAMAAAARRNAGGSKRGG